MRRIDTMPHDTQLPQLQVVTDAEIMKDVFQEKLPGFSENELRIDRLKLIQFSYHPGKSCTIGYLLKVKDLSAAKEGNQIFFAVMRPGADIESRYADALHQGLVEPEFDPPIYALPELDMILWGFPNDAKMKQLPHILNPESFAELAVANWARLGLPPEIMLKNVFSEVVKYVPQMRCTIRHTLTLSTGEKLTLYSKTFITKNFAERTYLTMHELWKATVEHKEELFIPEPVFYQKETNTMFMRSVGGRNADAELGNIDLNAAAARIGRGLARVHDCNIEGLPALSDHVIVAKLAQAEELLSNSDDAFKTRVEAIVEKLLKQYPILTPVENVPIHGGFRISQLLLVDGDFALIDFDDFLMGNPLTDIASFAAHLLYLPLKNHLAMDESYEAIRHFSRAYDQQSNRALPADQLAWHIAAQLVGKQAKKCVRLGKKNYHQMVNQLLGMAEDVISGRMTLI